MSTTWPVIEVFGPTIQGEGPEAGTPCHFVRFGGCDYRCEWCDSMYAVEPAEVRANAEKLGAGEIIDRLAKLGGEPRWVVLSGGNPALLDLDRLVKPLQGAGFKVAVETQGSRWASWLAGVDRLVISPKPPSSGMATSPHLFAFKGFMHHVANHGMLLESALKIVVADDADFQWARNLLSMYPVGEKHLSVCTPQSGDWEVNYPMDRSGNLILEVADRYAQLAEKVAEDPALADVKVLPQLHVIAWGDRRGV